jgi:hypothetical protein
MVLIGTAKGRNQFYDYMMQAREPGSGWFYKNQKASETKIIPADELERLRLTMGEAQYEQEMENNFDAALPGRFYADLVNEAVAEGRVTGDDLYDPSQKVHVAADLGLRDSTAWWFWQPRRDGIAVIDYYEHSNVHMDHYLEMLHDRGYDYAEIWLPHDSKAKTLATRRSTLEQLRVPSSVRPDLYDGGVVMPTRLTPKLAIQHGIDAVRLILPRCTFAEKACERGLDCLRSYRRQWHEHTQSFSDKPLHDWASNGADAFRYMALVADKSVAEMSERELSPVGYTLDALWKDRDDAWRDEVIRL